MNVTIRPEDPSDVTAIHNVTVAAFLHVPHTDHTEQFIISALREAGVLSISLVAEKGEVIVGHVAVSPVSISDGSKGWYGLGPVSVSPEHQGQGVGSSLMQSALGRLREMRAAGCVLLGDPAYYARFGFKPELGLVLPGAPVGYFQALSFGAELACGVVSYHAAFGAKG